MALVTLDCCLHLDVALFHRERSVQVVPAEVVRVRECKLNFPVHT